MRPWHAQSVPGHAVLLAQSHKSVVMRSMAFGCSQLCFYLGPNSLPAWYHGRHHQDGPYQQCRKASAAVRLPWLQVHVGWLPGGTAALAFRGTANAQDGLQDMKFIRKNIDYLQEMYPGVQAHTGEKAVQFADGGNGPSNV